MSRDIEFNFIHWTPLFLCVQIQLLSDSSKALHKSLTQNPTELKTFHRCIFTSNLICSHFRGLNGANWRELEISFLLSIAIRVKTQSIRLPLRFEWKCLQLYAVLSFWSQRQRLMQLVSWLLDKTIKTYREISKTKCLTTRVLLFRSLDAALAQKRFPYTEELAYPHLA
jgi:hypothetical protein